MMRMDCKLTVSFFRIEASLNVLRTHLRGVYRQFYCGCVHTEIFLFDNFDSFSQRWRMIHWLYYKQWGSTLERSLAAASVENILRRWHRNPWVRWSLWMKQCSGYGGNITRLMPDYQVSCRNIWIIVIQMNLQYSILSYWSQIKQGNPFRFI